MTNIVKNESEGYGYNYASLGDIVKQGYTLPKMKTATDEGCEYVFYFDVELNEWIRGARLVVPENKGMNKAQLYGSALTYARRYTALMALQLACADDEAIEDTDANGESKSVPAATEKQINYILKLYDKEVLNDIVEYYQVNDLSELNINQAKEVIERALRRNEEHNQ